MTGGYRAIKGGRTLGQDYRIWDIDNAHYLGGLQGPTFATFAEAAKAARVQEMRDVVTRHRAGIRHAAETGRKYSR